MDKINGKKVMSESRLMVMRMGMMVFFAAMPMIVQADHDYPLSLDLPSQYFSSPLFSTPSFDKKVSIPDPTKNAKFYLCVARNIDHCFYLRAKIPKGRTWHVLEDCMKLIEDECNKLVVHTTRSL